MFILFSVKVLSLNLVKKFFFKDKGIKKVVFVSVIVMVVFTRYWSYYNSR